jgi:hypothetical protein
MRLVIACALLAAASGCADQGPPACEEYIATLEACLETLGDTDTFPETFCDQYKGVASHVVESLRCSTDAVEAGDCTTGEGKQAVDDAIAACSAGS